MTFKKSGIALASVGLLALSACSSPSANETPAPTTPSSTAVEATTYGQAVPPNAPDEVMSLYSVEVPVGANLAPHQHPGLQMARINQGELTYTVVKGSVEVFEGTSTPGSPVKSKMVNAGTTETFKAGTTIAEKAGMIHQAKNIGTEPVKIDIAILVPKGDPFSVPAKK